MKIFSIHEVSDTGKRWKKYLIVVSLIVFFLVLWCPTYTTTEKNHTSAPVTSATVNVEFIDWQNDNTSTNLAEPVETLQSVPENHSVDTANQ